jgi:hypothetical protein
VLIEGGLHCVLLKLSQGLFAIFLENHAISDNGLVLGESSSIGLCSWLMQPWDFSV